MDDFSLLVVTSQISGQALYLGGAGTGQTNGSCDSRERSTRIIPGNRKKLFSSCLKEEMNNIKKLDLKKLYVLPRMKRTQIVADIIKNTPLFEELYQDYYIIRDMHSLEKIKSYVDLLISVNCASDEGRIIITRTIQIIGEHLKNTLESPKLSDSTCELILTCLPKDTRQIFNGLRNSLSHAHSFTKRRDLEKNADNNFYTNIQNDVKKINVVVVEIMFKNKVKVIKLLLKKMMNCTTLYDFKNVINPLKPVNIETFIQPQNLKSNLYSKSETVIDEMHRLENLIEKFSNTVIEKTPHETYLFNEIKNILKYEKSKVKNSEHNYFMGLIFFVSTLKQIKLSKIDENNLRLIKFRAQKTLDYLTSGIENKSLKTITQLVGSLQGSVVSRANIDICEIYELTHEIINLIEFQIDDVKWLSELKNKLSHYKFQKDEKELTLDQKKVTSEDQQIPKLEIILGNLRNILRKNNLDVYSKDSLISYKNNKNLQVIIEMLMLDVMCILSDSKNSAPNLLSLDKDCPLLIGKNLRNHLAHENALFDILQFDCSLAIIINAMKITSENIIDYKPTGKLFKNNSFNLKTKHERELSIINMKTNLFNAIASGDIEKFKLFIKKGADIKAEDFNLKTTLHFAAEGGNLDIIKLLKDNLNINDKDLDGQSPLHIASAFGYKKVVRFFIEELQANVDGDNFYTTPLHLAAKNGHTKVINVLLKSKCKIEKNILGCYPLFYAVVHSQRQLWRSF
ncbi:hypothetical protein TNCV_2954791 [Trichonephila clavipes]|nr:hypothetical protein TNCV_2954791 [Trichonephila clavipes]